MILLVVRIYCGSGGSIEIKWKKNKYIGLFLFIALISLTTVLAELNVKYTVYEGELDSSVA